MRFLPSPTVATDSLRVVVTDSLEAKRIAVTPNGAGPRVVIAVVPESELRDAMDAGADLVITTNAAAIRYASTRSDLVVAPLPWDRVYVLTGVDGVVIPYPQRAEMAERAVHGEARPANDNVLAGCPTPFPPRTTPANPSRVSYAPGDSIARSLAERLVSLAETNAVPGLGITRAGPTSDAGAVMITPTWIGRATVCGVPLIETRPVAIARRGVVGLTIDTGGLLRLDTGYP